MEHKCRYALSNLLNSRGKNSVLFDNHTTINYVWITNLNVRLKHRKTDYTFLRYYGKYIWPIHNQELMDIFKKPSIVHKIKRRKLEWKGHACRKLNSMIKRVLQENPRSKRPPGRPKLQWEYDIRKDFLKGENLGDQDWKGIVENKEEGKRICITAKWSQKP